MDYNTDKEVHTLELLKLRFGETSMKNCEVMVKDMDDSKRTNTHIREKLMATPTHLLAPPTTQPVVDAVMISHIFWPTLQRESLKHHPRIQADIDEFSAVYARLKNPRKLIWMHQLGTVELALDVISEHNTTTTDGGQQQRPIVETRTFTCTPLHATLILHFEDQPQWTADALANETAVPAHVIQKRMTFWISHRVVCTTAAVSPHATSVVYELASRGAAAHGSCVEESTSMLEEEESRAVSTTAHEEEEMEIFASYIVGMLTNLGQLPLERIHNMLKMFVTGSDVRYDKTPQQLSAFLAVLCRQETLECGPDGMYRLFQK